MEVKEGPASKRSRKESECIIHCSSESATAQLTELRDSDSWATLLRAAQIHKHEPLLQIASNLDTNPIPRINIMQSAENVSQ